MKKTTIIIDKKNSFLDFEKSIVCAWLSSSLTKITDNYIQNNILTFFSILTCYFLLLTSILYLIKFIKNRKNISYYRNVSNEDVDYIECVINKETNELKKFIKSIIKNKQE